MKKLRWIAVLGTVVGLSAPLQAQDLHGSIAFSQESTGGHAWGIAWSFDSPGSAAREAISQCSASGGTQCAQVGWFREACGALAIGDGNGYGTGWGATTAAAEQDALGQCRAVNANCRVEIARCSQSEDAVGSADIQEEGGDSEIAAAVDEPGPCQVWDGDEEYGRFIDALWSGPCVDGKASGEGRLLHDSYNRAGDLLAEIVFQGSIVDGRRQQGSSTTTYYDGSVDTCQWRDYELDGDTCVSSRAQ